MVLDYIELGFFKELLPFSLFSPHLNTISIIEEALLNKPKLKTINIALLLNIQPSVLLHC